MLNDPIAIALAGNPNGGKSTLFNLLTGLSQKTGNLPGVTVDKKTGSYTFRKKTVSVIDIPGLYSLVARSPDELISASLILDNTKTAPDLYVYVADATQLRKSLFLFYQMKMAGCKLILALNMSDILSARGISYNIPLLEELLETPVVEVSALQGDGVESLKEKVSAFSLGQKRAKSLGEYSPEDIFARIDNVLDKTVTRTKNSNKPPVTAKIDKWVMHPVFGYLIFFFLLFLIFQSVFSLAEYPMNWIEQGFAGLADILSGVLPEGILHDLVVNGIVPGFAGVMMFLPQIALLFFFLCLFEDTGYMVRAALLMDRVMRTVGMNGRSMIPLISGTACAIPAIMSARSISGRRDRLITMFVTPLVSCSARLPVFILLLSLLVSNEKWLGVFSYQGLILTALYLLGFLAAFLSAFLMKKSLPEGERDPFLLEVPEYRLPHWNHVLMRIYDKCRAFVTQAGKIILSISILLWVLSSYGPRDFSGNATGPTSLEESFAGKGGQLLEPVIRPLGYDWKIGIALISSFAAREVFVGTMATIYKIDDETDTDGIRQKLEKETDPVSGRKVYGTATIVSLLLFYLFALQCMSTLAVMRKESGGWKWPVLQFVYMGGLAYLSAFVAFQVLS